MTFNDDKDVIVYALAKVISYASRTQQIFMAQCVWWLALIIGLEERLVNHIENLHLRVKVTITSKEILADPTAASKEADKERPDEVLQECEAFLQDSRWLRRIARLKVSGIRRSNRIIPFNVVKKARGTRKDYSRTEGIEINQIERRKLAGECLRCARPSDRKGTHRVKDCIRSIMLDIGTAGYPRAKDYQRQEPSRDTSDSIANTDTADS
jgi:hypothetical protein